MKKNEESMAEYTYPVLQNFKIDDFLGEIKDMSEDERYDFFAVLKGETLPENSSNKIQELYYYLQEYVPETMGYLNKSNLEEFLITEDNTSLFEYPPAQREEFLSSMLLLEVEIKYRKDKIKEHFIGIGKALYFMKRRFKQVGQEKAFSSWYLSQGLNRDFVSLTLKRYDLYLSARKDRFFKYLDWEELKKFFEELPIRAIKAISKSAVSHEQRISYLKALYDGEKTTAEIEKEVRKNNETFNLTKAIKLVTKIDRNKKKYLSDEMRELLSSLEGIERNLNQIIEREKKQAEGVIIKGRKAFPNTNYNSNVIEYEDIKK